MKKVDLAYTAAYILKRIEGLPYEHQKAVLGFVQNIVEYAGPTEFIEGRDLGDETPSEDELSQ